MVTARPAKLQLQGPALKEPLQDLKPDLKLEFSVLFLKAYMLWGPQVTQVHPCLPLLVSRVPAV